MFQKHAETIGGIPKRAVENPRAMESLASADLAISDVRPTTRSETKRVLGGFGAYSQDVLDQTKRNIASAKASIERIDRQIASKVQEANNLSTSLSNTEMQGRYQELRELNNTRNQSLSDLSKANASLTRQYGENMGRLIGTAREIQQRMANGNVRDGIDNPANVRAVLAANDNQRRSLQKHNRDANNPNNPRVNLVRLDQSGAFGTNKIEILPAF